ncbi:MAG: thymidine kinase [Gammaproteobacteria bacterium]|jgi:thymidine kinase|nr:thymidine kinase [Gammaproteobacteria bacterium]
MAKLHFYYSAMNAGKTTVLLQSNYNYRERGMNTLLLTPLIDNRYGQGKIASRIGLEANAVTFDSKADLLAITQGHRANAEIHCVLVDEAQFLTREQAYQLTEIVDQLDIPVLAYGLRTDFKAEPFEGSKYLLAWSESLSEIKTICHCGRKATHVLRLDEQGNPIDEGAQIAIGGNDQYVSVCRKHYKLKQVA